MRKQSRYFSNLKIGKGLREIPRGYKIKSMMEENNKLFVFDKKEVVLIFVFVVVIAVTAFTLGVRIGKQLSLKEDGYTRSDVDSVNLKSVDEEYVESIVDDKKPKSFDEALEGQSNAKNESVKDVEARLREEMEKLAAGDVEKPAAESMMEQPKAKQAPAVTADAGDIKSQDDLYAPKTNVQGKFTIQLYANQSKAAAQDFADAFIVKGYDVIINEAEIPGKGTWYRVSIGAFDTIEGAKSYLKEESNLFKGEDYIIQQL